jgi:H+/Cl- antiporter ClcA
MTTTPPPVLRYCSGSASKPRGDVWPYWFGYTGIVIAAVNIAAVTCCAVVVTAVGFYVPGTSQLAPPWVYVALYCHHAVIAACFGMILFGCIKLIRRQERGPRLCAIAAVFLIVFAILAYLMRTYLYVKFVGLPPAAPPAGPVLGGPIAMAGAWVIPRAFWLLEFGWPIAYLIWWARPDIRRRARLWHGGIP